jgi:hypothetical protein
MQKPTPSKIIYLQMEKMKANLSDKKLVSVVGAWGREGSHLHRSTRKPLSVKEMFSIFIVKTVS